MIYVKGRWDVRLSKGWRYEPIMINAPHVPTPALHPQPRSSAARGETLQHLAFEPHSLFIFRVLVLKPSFLFLLVDIVPLFFSAHHLWPACDVPTGGASAGGDGGEAVTFKQWLSNPSLSDALSTLKKDKRKKRKTGREGSDILDGKWQTWCLDS